MTQPILAASDLSSGYNSRAVLKDISLEIAAGDFHGLIGPNGSGKSTLLKTLTGIIKPMSGRVSLYGKNIAELSPKDIARKVAVIPQEVSILFPFTAREIVAMGRHPHIGPLRRERAHDFEAIERAMRDTHTAALADCYMDELSGGERQRVIIARAMCQEPEALLLDEPTSHLDINHQAEIYELLTQLNREKGLAVFVISHDLNICAEYCHELILLKDGRIWQRGAPPDVLTRDTIRDVYGADVSVLRSPKSEAPIVTVIPRGRS